MKKFMNILKNVVLFENITEKDLENMIGCLEPKFCTYQKDSILFLTDGIISQVGIVLSGSVQIIKEDYLGNRTILAELDSGELFGEVFACAGVTKSPVTVLTAAGCEVLFIDFRKTITTCASSCSFHTRLIENMLKLLASKNLMLNQKIEIISKRSTREKIMSYFTMQAGKTKSNRFKIPFTKSELADYLCVDRSAMSRELSKMRDDGLIRFKGDLFELP